jgi:hypothetical protein
MVEPPSEAMMTSGYRPGLIADIIRAHMAYYAPAWGFGLPFEAKLAAEMAAFFTRYDERSDLTLTAYEGADKFLASVTLDGLDHAGPEGGICAGSSPPRGAALGAASAAALSPKRSPLPTRAAMRKSTSLPSPA